MLRRCEGAHPPPSAEVTLPFLPTFTWLAIELACTRYAAAFVLPAVAPVVLYGNLNTCLWQLD